MEFSQFHSEGGWSQVFPRCLVLYICCECPPLQAGFLAVGFPHQSVCIFLSLGTFQGSQPGVPAVGLRGPTEVPKIVWELCVCPAFWRESSDLPCDLQAGLWLPRGGGASFRLAPRPELGAPVAVGLVIQSPRPGSSQRSAVENLDLGLEFLLHKHTLRSQTLLLPRRGEDQVLGGRGCGGSIFL